MASPLRTLALGLALTGLAACTTLTSTNFLAEPLRAAADAPAVFQPTSAELRLPPADTLAGTGCLSPLLDPRTGDWIRLVRSGGGRGDYEVPGGRYGVREYELLRVECNTGVVIGVVAR